MSISVLVAIADEQHDRSEQFVSIQMELGIVSSCVQDSHSKFQPLEVVREVRFESDSDSHSPIYPDLRESDSSLEPLAEPETPDVRATPGPM